MNDLNEMIQALVEEILLERKKKFVKSKDQDGDGDNDFADVMIKRRVSGGEDLATAIKKTRKHDK